jgi:hypothetical protein
MKSKLTIIAALLVMLQSGGVHAADLKYVRTAKHRDFTRIVFEFQNAAQFKEPVIHGEGKFSVAFPDSTTVLPRRIFYKTSQVQPVVSVEFTEKETLLTAVVNLSFSYFKLKAFSLPGPDRVVIDAYLITPPSGEVVPEKSPAKELTRVVEKQPKVIPEKSPVKQTGDQFKIKENAPRVATSDPPTDPAKESLNKVPADLIKTRSAPPAQPEKLPPSTDRNYNLQIYMLILLNVLTIVIVLLISFNLFKKNSKTRSKYGGDISDALKTIDEQIAAIDAIIKRKLKKHD